MDPIRTTVKEASPKNARTRHFMLIGRFGFGFSPEDGLSCIWQIFSTNESEPANRKKDIQTASRPTKIGGLERFCLKRFETLSFFKKFKIKTKIYKIQR